MLATSVKMRIRKTLYKYVDLKGLESILKSSTLKFTNPQDFNDPFEFHENLVDRKMSAKHQLESLKKYGQNLTEDSIKSYKQQVRIETRDKHYTHIVKLFENKKLSTYVTCFSEIDNNLLMWSHYADKHRGACIGFDTESLRSDYKTDSYFSNVTYSRRIVTKNLSKLRDAAIAHWISSKGKDWKYEKEVRIVLGTIDSEFMPFNLHSIKEIIFGCCVTENDKQSIENLFLNKNNLDWISISEMKMSSKLYKLEKINRH